MHICYLDVFDTYGVDGDQTIRYTSASSILDYDVVVWDIEGTFSRYSEKSPSLREDKKRRDSEITDFLRLGRTLLLFVPFPHTKTVLPDEPFSPNEEWTPLALLPPIGTIPAITPSIGKKIDWSVMAFQQLADRYQDFHYRGYFERTFGNPFAFVAGTKKLVGTWMTSGNGKIIFLPRFAVSGQSQRAFRNEIIRIINELSEDAGSSAAPDWVASYRLPEEICVLGELNALEDERRELCRKIDAKRNDLKVLEDYKVLLWGTGRPLELQVLRVLEELGAQVEPGEPGRDDIRLTWKGRVGIIEVKGVSKSASEKQAAQLEKWVLEYRSCQAEEAPAPKGILLVNSFCETDLSLRPRVSFPEQMLRFSTNRDHCLMTTSQLLEIFLVCRNDLAKVAQALDEIFRTVGVLRGHDRLFDLLTTQPQPTILGAPHSIAQSGSVE